MTPQKKKRLTRKERKQQRREEIARTREARGWKPRQAKPSRPPLDDEVAHDALPFFQSFGTVDGTLSAAMMEDMMGRLIDSGDLADEPEFAEIMINPLQCVNTFVAVGQEMNVEPESLDDLPEEEREDIQFQMLEESTRRLLTDDLRRDILQGLNDLRVRLKRSGRRGEAAKAAALQSFLSGDETEGIWPLIGLVQALFGRSLAVGFELYQATMEVGGPGELDASEILQLDNIEVSPLASKIEALIEKAPGLRGFLNRQVDDVREEGMEALFTGELCLQLFTEEELDRVADLYAEATGRDPDADDEAEESGAEEMSADAMRAFLSLLTTYVTELFTPARLDQLRDRLAAALTEPAYNDWIPFILMVAEDMKDENAVEYEKGFLVRALIGETRAAGARDEADEEAANTLS